MVLAQTGAFAFANIWDSKRRIVKLMSCQIPCSGDSGLVGSGWARTASIHWSNRSSDSSSSLVFKALGQDNHQLPPPPSIAPKIRHQVGPKGAIMVGGLLKMNSNFSKPKFPFVAGAQGPNMREGGVGILENIKEEKAIKQLSSPNISTPPPGFGYFSYADIPTMHAQIFVHPKMVPLSIIHAKFTGYAKGNWFDVKKIHPNN